ncbi:cysteine desulfurase family protein [Janibacter cremeus]|uniref:cysteine desulfurase family protein n=1 Tax=Janibacter cremeus TaxID=1285192 RepID=UPI0023F94BB8|nr:cysteine desulfurase family protein [Janibacter cremeus]WEV79012.1 cysteine desulfurase family protein [Janibacter cremeus]
MSSASTYLDHNATTPVAPEVAEAMWPYLVDHFGNPSSTTPLGARARAAVDHAREQVAGLVGAHPDEIVFTSGGTESNNLAIRGTAAVASTYDVLTSAIEHPATVAPLAHLRGLGWRVHELPVDDGSRVRLTEVPTAPVGLGSLILAHNETGAVQPVAEFAERVHAAGGVVHADAAQAVGKIAVSVEDLGVDLMSIAGHKLYAPKGVGALVVRRGTTLVPLLRGAGQEGGLRPGTENVPGIVALGAAAELAGSHLEAEGARQAGLRDLLWEELARVAPDLVRVSPTDGCLPNTLMVAAPGRIGAEVLARVEDVAASTGSACHAGEHTPSAALLAMGLDHETALGAVRLSLGRSTTRAQIQHAAEVLGHALTGGPPPSPTVRGGPARDATAR